jgi:isoaspartyl peptidase/L-asparaginase-like protein (Ntn-hydrolase superfamily)
MANITVIDKYRKLAAYTIVNGRIVSFENRIVRSNIGSGYWTTKFGMVKSTGIGDIPMFTHV